MKKIKGMMCYDPDELHNLINERIKKESEEKWTHTKSSKPTLEKFEEITKHHKTMEGKFDEFKKEQRVEIRSLRDEFHSLKEGFVSNSKDNDYFKEEMTEMKKTVSDFIQGADNKFSAKWVENDFKKVIWAVILAVLVAVLGVVIK